MSATTRRDLVDRLLGGTLDTLLLEVLNGDRDRSFFLLSAELIDKHNVTVSPETLRRWSTILGKPEQQAS